MLTAIQNLIVRFAKDDNLDNSHHHLPWGWDVKSFTKSKICHLKVNANIIIQEQIKNFKEMLISC